MIIGRHKEKKLLERSIRSKESEFITLYGRRRVGKTYLIKEFFREQDCLFFHVTGLQDGRLKQQLHNFTEVISRTFFQSAPLQVPLDWSQALRLLTEQIKSVSPERKVVIFFDELPWMATRKSNLMHTIDFYWNNQWAWMGNVIFIACGSSASWILKNIIYHKGGLHNRTTIEMKLLPFKLCETDEYLTSKGLRLNETHILSLYMAVGGIPYYLDYVEPGLTAQQNIQQLFFDEGAPLAKEYTKLFESLFDGAADYRELIEVIAQKKTGVSRSELIATLKYSSVGGLLTEKLSKLCDAGFIEEYIPWGKKIGSFYKVIDEFCLFYIRWVKSYQGARFDRDYWMIQSQRPSYYSWAGYAFEAVCTKHLPEILRALGISGVQMISSWRFSSKDEASAQIDLLFDRLDNAITLCEIKYTEKPFVLDKRYAANLQQKMEVFQRQTKTEKQLFFAMVSAHGLRKSWYADEMISGVVTLKDLYKNFSS